MSQRITHESRIWSPLQYFLAILATIFFAELGVMVILSLLPWFASSELLVAVFDSTLLTLLVAPLLWVLLISPLRAMASNEARKSAAIIENARDGILFVDDQAKICFANPAAQRMLGMSADELCHHWVYRFFPSWRPNSQATLDVQQQPAMPVFSDCVVERCDGEPLPLEVGINSLELEGRPYFTFFLRDATERKLAERALAEAHQRVVDMAHASGKAEVATCVLHNVGNVMTNVQVLASTIGGKIHKSRLSGLGKVSALMAERQSDLANFLAHDMRGKQLPAYLAELSQCWEREQQQLLHDVATLSENIDHVNRIVASQQAHATAQGVWEVTTVSELVDTAVNMIKPSLDRIELIRDIDPTIRITIDRHKLLQILVNLIGNARDAVKACSHESPQIVVRAYNASDDRVRMEVVDNGVGIAAESLPKIFGQAYTTKENGHGFGLHFSAIAVRQLDGMLSVRSEGINQGATFVVDLPSEPSKVGIAS